MSDGHTLLPPIVLDRHIAILGKTGSGKSNAAKTVAEHLMSSGKRVCVIDPTGTWWGLRLAADGAGASNLHPVIFGGHHADVPVGRAHGAAVAEAIGTTSTSAIIDTRVMKVAERTEFFSGFAEQLLSVNRGDLHLIIDEAHLFAPQGRVNDPRSGAMLHAANNLVSLGRGIGLRIIMISQRPAKLHKDSLTQVETLIAMRLIAPQDRGAIKDWIAECADPDTGKEIIASLASLPTGDAWVWAPGIDMLARSHFPLASTFDTGKPTAHQQALDEIDLSEIVEKLGTIEQEAKDNDPKLLKKQIADLQAELRKKPTGASQAELQAAEARGYERGYETCRLDTHRSSFREGFHAAAQQVMAAAAKAAAIEPDDIEIPPLAPSPSGKAPVFDTGIAGSNPAGATTSRSNRANPQRKPPAATDPETGVSGSEPEITPALQRVLDSIGWWHHIGIESVQRGHAAVTAGLSPKASTFGVYTSKLSDLGYVETAGPGAIRLTESGKRRAHPPADAKVLDMAMAKVSNRAAEALRFVADRYPESISRDEIADQMCLSRTASTLGVYLSESSKLGFIETDGPGRVRAADFLFAGH